MAKAAPGFRFYALHEKIYREDILAHAYAQCRSNKGVPGVDRQDFADRASAIDHMGAASEASTWHRHRDLPGLRIDLILASEALAQMCTTCVIDK
jgi:hypothetical protein